MLKVLKGSRHYVEMEARNLYSWQLGRCCLDPFLRAVQEDVHANIQRPDCVHYSTQYCSGMLHNRLLDAIPAAITSHTLSTMTALSRTT